MFILTLFTKQFADICEGLCNAGGTGLTNVSAGPNQVKVIMSIIFGVIGAVALIFVILGGLKFITSQGDPQATSKARQTVIFALIGVVVALSAETLINFVIGKL